MAAVIHRCESMHIFLSVTGVADDGTQSRDSRQNGKEQVDSVFDHYRRSYSDLVWSLALFADC